MSDQTTPCTLRAAFLTKDGVIAAFFFHSNDKVHMLWTYDPRLQPNLYYFGYQDKETLETRFNEMLAISRDNGWIVNFNGIPNNAQLS